MNDFEKIVDNFVIRAVKYYSDSDTYLKYHCIFSSPIVGRYDGATQKIAAGIRRSPSTVEHHAHAHWMYKTIRANGNKPRARYLWRILTASHFWSAWEIHKAGFDAFQYLDNAESHGWSVRDMMEEYRRDVISGTAPMIYKRKFIALRGICDELLADKKTPRKVKEWILAMPEEVSQEVC